MVELMLVKWLESPDVHDLNLSTLIHQILSHLTQTGGMPAQALFDALVKRGPFRKVTPDIFQKLLKSLLQRSLLGSVPPNLLIVGTQGEFLTSSRDFYAAFMGQEELKVEYQGESIGKIPPDRVPPKGENLLLGGRRWVVVDVLVGELTVIVFPSNDLKPPYFAASGTGTGDKIARQMRLLLEQSEVPAYLDENAKLLLDAARHIGKLSGAVGGNGLIVERDRLRLFPWAGLKIRNTLWALARFHGIKISSDRLSISYCDVSPGQLEDHFQIISSTSHDPMGLAEFLPLQPMQKFDAYLETDLLNLANCYRFLDLPRTIEWIKARKEIII
ncbi:MAG: hypothetical protein WDO13_08270 [Verrucomicrobiota bacterium]